MTALRRSDAGEILLAKADLLSRRQALKRLALIGLGSTATAPFIAGCSNERQPTTNTPNPFCWTYRTADFTPRSIGTDGWVYGNGGHGDRVLDLATVARRSNALMGADGPRTYFMGFQTNAEARGTGGLLGGFGIISFDKGVPTVDMLAPNTQLDKTFAPLDLGPDYTDLYGFTNASTDYRNSNQSPHFPYAAQIWKSMWAQQTGMNVDGAIAIDPVALSYVLGAVGPVTMPDGEVITKDNVVELTESTAYIRFSLETNQPARKKYLQDIAKEVVNKITGPVQSPRNLLDALGKAVSEGRIAVWSANTDDQKLLEETPLAHVVPDDAAPYTAVIINNLGGNKLDYYLKRGIEYAADGCDGPTRNSTITIKLASSVPSGLPDFLAASNGLIRDAPINVPVGTMLTSVRLNQGRDAEERGRQRPTGAGHPRNGSWSPDLRYRGSDTARKVWRTGYSSLGTDGTRSAASPNSAAGGRRHSCSGSARVQEMKQRPLQPG
ncbi:MAG: hypothetical protein QOD39_230, partial [Mycobacterium sp.]|nr:hypothetical protein [Mycobacterium sp.]